MLAKTKTAAYIKRMISRTAWTSKLPPLAKIAKDLSVSYSTVLNTVKVLEHQHIVENCGNGYLIIPKKLGELYLKNRSLYYLASIRRNLRIIELLDRGAVLLDNYAILKNKYEFIVGSLITGNILKTSLDELVQLDDNIVTTDMVLKTISLRPKFIRQTDLKPIRNTILTHKKELNL